MLANVWHDCDPGHDDAFALMYCIASEKINLVGVSSVHGNQTTEKTYANIMRVLYIAGALDMCKRIPVVCGARVPSVRPSMTCPEIHGTSGLGGIDWDPVDAEIEAQGYKLTPDYEPSSELVADKIHEVFVKLGGSPLILLVTGCHTNIAKYVEKYPEDIATGLVSVSAMGGCVRVHGNTGPWQEFNIQIDPEAFATVLEKMPEKSVTIAPLDVTHTVLASDEIIERMRKAAGGKLGEIVGLLLEFFKDTYKSVFGLPAPPVHDPVAAHYIVAALEDRIHEDGKEYKNAKVPLFNTYIAKSVIETEGKYTSGCICIERYPGVGMHIDNGKMLRVCDSCDVNEFWVAMEKTLAIIGKQTPLH